MSERDPDTSAGVYATVSVLVMALCLLLVLVLPPQYFSGKWIGIAALTGCLVGAPVLDRVAHRSRIRQAVSEIGGTMTSVKRVPFWRSGRINSLILSRLPMGRRIKYEVDYTDLSGRFHEATCLSGWFYGVQWLEDTIVE